jgi:peptidoglycan/LPS O-acetylase OafA/YrhL
VGAQPLPKGSTKKEPVDARLKRNQNLDCLRALAVCMVLCRHVEYLPGSSRGWAGVDLFFVLSGFLISGLLFQQWTKTGSLRIPRFYLRRGLKIYPAFYMLLVATPLLAAWMPKRAPSQYLTEIFFLQSYLRPVWTHTWSLSVEEHFYLFLPIALWIMQRLDKSPDPFRHLLKVFAVAAVGCPILRTIAAYHQPWWNWIPTMQTHLRIDALLFGVLLCYLRRFRPETFRRLAQSPLGWPVMAMAAVMLLEFEKREFIMKSIGLTIVYLGFGFLLIRTVDARPPRLARPLVSFLARIGFYSYSIYLWHLAIRLLVLHWAHLSSGFLQFAAYFVAAILGGIGASKLIEIPVLAYRDRYFPDEYVPARAQGLSVATGR